MTKMNKVEHAFDMALPMQQTAATFEAIAADPALLLKERARLFDDAVAHEPDYITIPWGSIRNQRGHDIPTRQKKRRAWERELRGCLASRGRPFCVPERAPMRRVISRGQGFGPDIGS